MACESFPGIWIAECSGSRGFIEAGQRIHRDQERKDQLLAIRGGPFVLVSLLLGVYAHVCGHDVSCRNASVADPGGEGMTKLASSARSAVVAAYMNVLNELIDLHERPRKVNTAYRMVSGC